MLNTLPAWLSLRPVSRRLDPARSPHPPESAILGMITLEERRALAWYAERIWSTGAARDGLIVEGGPFVGASTAALAVGLDRSPLREAERLERIWSYDLFLTTPGMAAMFGDRGPKAGESFRPVFEANIAPLRRYVRVFEGDIRTAPPPDRPIALLFLDILWSWDATQIVSRNTYPQLQPGRSLLVHQDFVYPFYPWVVLSMGLLERELPFAYNVPHSSVVFDVARPIHADAIEDGRNLSVAAASAIYDRFIDRVPGWGKGALALGKALFLASQNRVPQARALVDEVSSTFAAEQLVTQYLPAVLGYCSATEANGKATPLDQLSGV